MDALLAALDDSPPGVLRVRTLCEQDSTLANTLDNFGISALMHASLMGQAGCCSALLACSADPRLRRASDGATALTLAAASCKPASICALLQHDATLVDAVDGGGRTALHHAVAAGSVSTAKYLLGRWGADDTVVDARGDSPLHLCTSPKLLLLLAHGPPSRPLGRLGTSRNKLGRTPVEAWEAAGCADLVQAARTAGSWLYHPHPQELSAAVSFLHDSPARVPPRAKPVVAWPRRILPVHFGIVLLPFAILGFGCFFPLLGPRVWLGFWLWVSLAATLCLCAVPPHCQPRRPWQCHNSLTSPGPNLRRLVCSMVALRTRDKPLHRSGTHWEASCVPVEVADSAAFPRPGAATRLGHVLQAAIEPASRRAAAGDAHRADHPHQPQPPPRAAAQQPPAAHRRDALCGGPRQPAG